MKVLIISHTYISAINREKWKVLAQQHKDVVLLVIFPTRWPSILFNHTATIDPAEHGSNCTFIALDTIKAGNELLYHYKHFQLFKHIASFKPDVIHVEQGDGALSHFQITVYCKLLSLKSKIVFFTWLNWTPKYSLKHQIFLSPIEKINLNNAHGAIVGNIDAKKIIQKKGFNKPIMVLPQLGVNMQLFNPHLHQASKSQKTIGFIGRLTEEKGIYLLLNAFVKLQNQFKDWNLVFVGNGKEKNHLTTLIAHYKLFNRIQIYKTVPHEDIPKLLHTMDILVLPSFDTATWREQFGHVLIEAMACKIPVIGSNAGAISEVVGQAGLLFSQGDENALLAELQTLMQDEDMRKKFGTLGYERAQKYYSHEAIAQQTYDFWKRLSE